MARPVQCQQGSMQAMALLRHGFQNMRRRHAAQAVQAVQAAQSDHGRRESHMRRQQRAHM